MPALGWCVYVHLVLIGLLGGADGLMLQVLLLPGLPGATARQQLSTWGNVLRPCNMWVTTMHRDNEGWAARTTEGVSPKQSFMARAGKLCRTLYIMPPDCGGQSL
jgi:hypothetical protein